MLNPVAILKELRAHAPFTALGTLSGLAVLAAMVAARVPPEASERLFEIAHPLHVAFSALVTAAMLRRHGFSGPWRSLGVAAAGAIAIGTLSDSLIPFAGEWLLGLPRRALHVGFLEEAWLVNPAALLGAAAGVLRPRTHVPHAGHVLLSTWASLFHMAMAMTAPPGLWQTAAIAAFLFVAVWIPCCTSDILFPLLVVPPRPSGGAAPPRRCSGACHDL